jgi:hypothetical protein
MSERIREGTWVELHRTLLAPGERAPQVPDETRKVPLEMKVKGFLTGDAAIGDDAEIVTPAGRRLRGTLSRVNPAYDHGFGAPVAELLAVGPELRALLAARGRTQ